MSSNAVVCRLPHAGTDPCQHQVMLLMRWQTVSWIQAAWCYKQQKILQSPSPLVICSQGEPTLICEKPRVPVADLPILVFFGKCQPGSMMPGRVFLAWSQTFTPVPCWRSFYRALAVLTLLILALRRRQQSFWWVKDLLWPCLALSE